MSFVATARPGEPGLVAQDVDSRPAVAWPDGVRDLLREIRHSENALSAQQTQAHIPTVQAIGRDPDGLITKEEFVRAVVGEQALPRKLHEAPSATGSFQPLPAHRVAQAPLAGAAQVPKAPPYGFPPPQSNGYAAAPPIGPPSSNGYGPPGSMPTMPVSPVTVRRGASPEPPRQRRAASPPPPQPQASPRSERGRIGQPIQATLVTGAPAAVASSFVPPPVAPSMGGPPRARPKSPSEGAASPPTAGSPLGGSVSPLGGSASPFGGSVSPASSIGFAAFGDASASGRSASPVRMGYDGQAARSRKEWAIDQTCQIGRNRDDVNDLVSANVRLLDEEVISSVNQAVDGLNRGTIDCPEDCCIVFSASNKSFYLLYKYDKHDTAKSVLQVVWEGAKDRLQALAVGKTVRISGYSCQVTGPLGKGSFGIVWAGQTRRGSPAGDGLVAIKEMVCRSHKEVEAAQKEGQLLYELHNGAADAHVECVAEYIKSSLDRVPCLVAAETQTIGTDCWRVRLAMTRVPGIPLDKYLEKRRPDFGQLPPRSRFAEGCHIALEMLEQLVPTFEIMSLAILHRDVNAHNILVHEMGEIPAEAREASSTADLTWRGRLRFSLVDFGLAVRRREWDDTEPSANSWHLVDIGGDCRYWPMGAWLQFECGCDELAKYPQLMTEYQAQLDRHALGLTALQVLGAVICPSPDPGGRAAGSSDDATGTDGTEPRGIAAHEVLAAIPEEAAAVHEAWEQYWEDATLHWKQLLAVFRTGGDQFALKATCIEAGVHNIVGARLASVRSALRDAELHGLEAPREDNQEMFLLLRNARPLFAGLLELVSAGGVVGMEEEAAEPSSWQAVRAAIGFNDAEPRMAA